MRLRRATTGDSAPELSAEPSATAEPLPSAAAAAVGAALAAALAAAALAAAALAAALAAACAAAFVAACAIVEQRCEAGGMQLSQRGAPTPRVACARPQARALRLHEAVGRSIEVGS